MPGNPWPRSRMPTTPAPTPICGSTQTTDNCLHLVPAAQLIDAYGIVFLDKYLKGLDEPVLTGNGAGFAAYHSKP